MPASISFLQVRGLLDEAMVYMPLPGYESPTRQQPGGAADTGEIDLVALDAEGRIRTIVRPHVRRPGCGRAGEVVRFFIYGELPLHPDAVTLRLRRGEAVLHESVIAPQPPHIGAASMERVGDDVTVCAAAEAAAGLTYAVVIESESGARLRIAEGLTEPAHVFEIGEISMTGTVRVLVEVSDGVRSSESEAGLLDRPPVPATVHMLAPATSAPQPFGQPVSLLGCWLDESGATHPGDALQWFLDGEPLAAGPIAVIDAVAAGSHRLTLVGHMPQGTVETSTELVIAEPDQAYEDWRSLMGHLRPV